MAKLIKSESGKQYALVINKKQLDLIKILVGHVSGSINDYPGRVDVELYETLIEGTDIMGWTAVFERLETDRTFIMKKEFIDRKE